MKAYSMDLRERVLADCDDGMSTSEVADAHRVSAAWVRRLKQRRRETGEVAPRVARPGPAPVLTGQADRLREVVRAHPDRTAAEYRQLLGTSAAVVTVWRALRRLGLSHKKSAPGGRAGPPGRG
jgi:transposase